MLWWLLLAGCSRCPEGQVWGHTVDDRACVPEACGRKRWPDAPEQGDVLYVSQDGDYFGEGTRRDPLDLDSAIDAADGPTTILLDAGQHGIVGGFGTPEELPSDADLAIVGRCPELTGIDGVPLYVEPGGRVALRHIAVTDEIYQTAGLWLGGGDFELRDVALDEIGMKGLFAYGGAQITGKDVHFRDTNGTGMLVWDGARVELDEVTISGSSEYVGIYDGTHWGIAVDAFGYAGETETLAGGEVILRNCTIEANEHGAVSARGPGTRVELHDCVVSGNNWGDLPASALYVASDALVLVRDSLVEDNVGYGVAARGGGRAELERVEVRGVERRDEEVWGWGVLAIDAGVIVGTGVLVEGADGAGVVVSGDGSQAELEDSIIQGNGRPDAGAVGSVWGGWGAEVLDGGQLVLADSIIADNQELGLLVSGADASATLRGVALSGTALTPDLSGGRGIEVSRGGALLVEDLVVRDAYAAGLLVSGSGSTVELSDVEIGGVGADTVQAAAVGVLAQSYASVAASNLSVSDTAGPTVLVASAAALACDDCTLAPGSVAGAVVGGAGTLLLSNSAVAGMAGACDAGVLVRPDATLPGVTLDGSRVEGCDLAAVWLPVPGQYQLLDSELVAGAGVTAGSTVIHGDAVFAAGGVQRWDGSSGLWIDGSTLRDAPGAGLMLHQASASVGSATFSGNVLDVVQQQCDDVDDVELGTADLDTLLCSDTERIVDLTVDFALELTEAEPLEATAPAELSAGP